MRMIKRVWDSFGLHIRVLLPIILFALIGNVVRCYLTFSEEVADTQNNYQREIKDVKNYARFLLMEQARSGDVAAMRDVANSQFNDRLSLSKVEWHRGTLVTNILIARTEKVSAPVWFTKWIALPSPVLDVDLDSAGTTHSGLTLFFNPISLQNRLWMKFVRPNECFIVFFAILLVVLGQVFKNNLRGLSRLVLASRLILQGNYRIHVKEQGALEVRTLIGAFNQMAENLDRSMQSLNVGNQALEEQLSFIRQLTSVLPMPLFSRDMHGCYLWVNPAFEQFFDVSEEQIIGKNSDVIPACSMSDKASWRFNDADLLAHPGRKMAERMFRGPDGMDHHTLYYSSTVMSVDGVASGVIGAIIDITDRKRMELELQSEKERAVVTLSSIGDAVISTDLDGNIVTLNTAAEQLVGVKAEDAKGLQLDDVIQLMDEVSQSVVGSVMLLCMLKNGIGHTSSSLLRVRSGKEYWVEQSAAAVCGYRGQMLGCVLVLRDKSERRHLQRQLTWQAGHDVLTGLPNRTTLIEQIKRAALKSHTDKRILALCLLDLDQFKPINDAYGHDVGDRVIIEVALRLAQLLRGSDTMARMGGDEFALLLNDIGSMEQLNTLLNSVLAELIRPISVLGRTMQVGASIGVVLLPQVDADPDTFLRYADQEMYRAKQNGRNRYQLYDAASDLASQSRYHHLENMRRALQHGQFVLYYQPKVNMRTGQVIGMEALLRWQHPERGIVAPGEFLPAIEQTDLIVDIGEWVLHEALDQLLIWGDARLPVSVNIAARHFQRSDFVVRLKEILSRHPNLPPGYLEIEILESVAVTDLEHVRNVIDECRELGISFALDDFGTGYSSLTYLKRLPVELLKIDQSFVRDMLDDADGLGLVEAVIGLAAVCKRQVIAEGVETPEHGLLLMRFGCDQAQGYGIARPMPAADVVNWISQYKPPASWTLWMDIQWDMNDLPLLVASYDAAVSKTAEKTPLILGLKKQITSTAQTRFQQWCCTHGALHYGTLPEFKALQQAQSDYEQDDAQWQTGQQLRSVSSAAVDVVLAPERHYVLAAIEKCQCAVAAVYRSVH